MALVALLVAVATVSAGCSRLLGCGTASRPDDLAREDLFGRYSGDGAGSLELTSDGRFTAQDLVFDFDADDGPKTSGVGTWALNPTTSAIGADLSLTFEERDGTRSGANLIDVAGSREVPVLWYFASDPDSCDVRTLRAH